MSWQADIKKLHEKSSSLGVDLTEFEDDLRDDEGWYTESNIQEFIECQNLQLAKQQEEIEELKSAIESALNIKDLWVYNGDIPKWHEGEAQALSKMHDKFVDLLAKHNKGE